MTRALERSLLLAASPREAWALLATPEGLATWLADRAARTPRGVRLEWDVPAGARGLELEVVEAAPERRFVFRWQTGGARTDAAFYLTPEGAGTRLVLVETGFGDGPLWDVAIEEEAEGWDEALLRLVRLLGAAESRHIVLEADVPAPTERVFAALTREEELRRWWMREARFEPRPGAAYRFADPACGPLGQGRVRVVAPHETIALSWHGDPELPPTELTVHVEPAPAGARVRLDHAGWGTGAEFNRALSETEEAWQDALFLLTRYLLERPR